MNMNQRASFVFPTKVVYGVRAFFGERESKLYLNLSKGLTSDAVTKKAAAAATATAAVPAVATTAADLHYSMDVPHIERSGGVAVRCGTGFACEIRRD